ncbi:MAG: hypothetical protein Aureis2KO_22320 [Aureisphaera sp.]
MKRITTLLLLVFLSFTTYAQSDCEPYLPIDVGTQWEMTHYNAKGKNQGKTSYELLDKVSNGSETIFTVQTKAFDKKGKELLSNTFEAKCVDGQFEFDMAMKMDGTSMGAFQNMDFEVDASRYEIPSMDAAAGTSLEDGSLRISSTGGPIGINMTIDITNRMVEAKETITTPAGDFNCLVLTQDVSTKVVMNIKATSKEWYSPNIGVVRTESFNKKGKMTGYSEITSLTK